MKTVGTYVTREEAEAARAEMMKRPATPYQDSTLAKFTRFFWNLVSTKDVLIRPVNCMIWHGST